MSSELPYKIAVLCFLFDEQGRMLLLHRAQPPNQGLYSAIGGKLDMANGESPTDCALREIWEEAELKLGYEDIRLAGLISERAYEGQTHWLLFVYEVVHPVQINRMEFREGVLEWHPWEDIESLAIPETDRQVIYPMYHKYRGNFFHVHIDCVGDEMTWRLEYPAPNTPAPNTPH